MSGKLSRLFNWFPELRRLYEARGAEDFDDFLDLHFARCIQRMEAEAHHLAGDSEEKLSAFLAAALSMPGLSVVREAYSNGRVDLTIRSESLLSAEQRLAEAKIYDGPVYHAQAITQLISRYSTGRQPSGYVIEYVKKPGIADIVMRLRSQADAELPECQEGLTSDHDMRWAYVSRHRHSSEELLRVVHININLKR
ncbi:hypothetical protein [Methylomonas koyamae]|uniref:hypothetical protein n=1 Tax=Methylomonas koyamae TaxID=702114 RepID=UPI0006D08875|nr:hypothetical protein [Methylomonas koyamae]BBL58854.1 hypothetical protein MKFW12EY_24670 [Methylomonas koyamae]